MLYCLQKADSIRHTARCLAEAAISKVLADKSKVLAPDGSNFDQLVRAEFVQGVQNFAEEQNGN